MSTATVYRVEHENGFGPYMHDIRYDEHEVYCMLECHSDDNHPDPMCEGEPWYNGWMPDDHVCGFLTEEQMHNWFTPAELNVLFKYGFTVKTYEVSENDIAIGNKQITFKKP